MFTLLVSWLLVACVPALLMLAALGLGRLEKELSTDIVTATDVDEFRDRGEPVNVRTLAREGMREAPEYPPSTGRHTAPSFPTDSSDRGEVALPTRIHSRSGTNPQFRATKHINHV